MLFQWRASAASGSPVTAVCHPCLSRRQEFSSWECSTGAQSQSFMASSHASCLVQGWRFRWHALVALHGRGRLVTDTIAANEDILTTSESCSVSVLSYPLTPPQAEIASPFVTSGGASRLYSRQPHCSSLKSFSTQRWQRRPNLACHELLSLLLTRYRAPCAQALTTGVVFSRAASAASRRSCAGGSPSWRSLAEAPHTPSRGCRSVSR